ncbi:MAG: SufE family protein [Hyphomicrobiales bacterium]|nr:SufE family protein [Hyphomicrobiales bacterium]
MSIDRILEDFEFLDDWEDRYRYVIELGRGLEPLDEAWRTPENKVQGCVSQVWLHSELRRDDGNGPALVLHGDSDAHIVRGLIAILFALFSGRTPRAVLEADPNQVFERLDLREHLTPQRSNGLTAMVERIKRDAREAQESMASLH